MPSNKKKSSSQKKETKQARRVHAESSAQLKEFSAEFRELLLSGRREYAKGRSYEAVALQTRAIEFGDELLPGFDQDSLVKVSESIVVVLFITHIINRH